MLHHLPVVLILFIFIDQDFVDARSRQKRCIVIQKQSSTHRDSVEDDGGDNEEYRKPQPKGPRPDRLRRPYGGNNGHEAENVSPELLKYILPIPFSKEYRRNRFFRRF